MDHSNIAKKKLEEYRKRKEREIYINETKLKAKTFFESIFPQGKKMKTEDEPEREPLVGPSDEVVQDETVDIVDSASESEIEDVNKSCTFVDWMYYSLWFTLWVILYIIFIKLGFGLVYLVSSGLIGMYLNTRTTPRKPNEASAYSVFNKNCESIDGTLKAEQFERELLYGPSVVR